ncbi:SSI family serine proteinase inhibitor [Streptomyces sp. NPDC048483]|uniref:SSI family serine proteinase inhibitor n=1 Tax=Streptomyces sp. NPDC048483 TaxID=3154927 RepID=UPI0034451D36
MPYRRTLSLLAAVTAAMSLASAGSAASASAAPIPIPLPDHGPVDVGFPAHRHRAADRLTVTIADSGSSETDGTFVLRCHPYGGTHFAPRGACRTLDGRTRWGRDTFAPVPQGAYCTMIYGSAATAHVTGTWAGRPVNARFERTNGCEIARWERFEPLLPHPTS